MGLLAGLKRGLISGEVKRLLKVYRPTLLRFGIEVNELQLLQELIRLYEAKGGGSDADDSGTDRERYQRTGSVPGSD